MSKAPDEVDGHIGARLRMRRQAVGISQEQLGVALGLTFQQVQKYEKGLNRIGAGRLYHIAEVLGVDVSFFYEGLSPKSRSLVDGVDDDDATVRRFVTSAEGYLLTRAFSRISDAQTRARLIELVRTIADSEPQREERVPANSRVDVQSG